MQMHLRAPDGGVVLVLTDAQARGLAKLASEGAARVLPDPAAATKLLGGPSSVAAAHKALRVLQAAAA